MPVTWGAYHIAIHVRGMEDLMLDFAMRPKYAEYLINTIAEISLAAHARMLEQYSTGIDIVYMADDYCSQRGPLFSPDAFRRFIMPYLTKTVEMVHRHGKKFLLHVCGAVRPLLPMIVEAGVDMLEPIQIRAEGMNPRELKREFGEIPVFLWRSGPPTDVVQRHTSGGGRRSANAN
ncbi:MAG: uroporphyrinogen decarboxylase family protein [Kiritimatiellia bacterium]